MRPHHRAHFISATARKPLAAAAAAAGGGGAGTDDLATAAAAAGGGGREGGGGDAVRTVPTEESTAAAVEVSAGGPSQTTAPLVGGLKSLFQPLLKRLLTTRNSKRLTPLCAAVFAGNADAVELIWARLRL